MFLEYVRDIDMVRWKGDNSKKYISILKGGNKIYNLLIIGCFNNFNCYDLLYTTSVC